MHTTRLKKVGGSVMLTVPPALLNALSLGTDNEVDTVMACKFFPGPVSRIAGMPDTAPSGAVVSSLPRFLRSYRIMP